MCVGLCVCVGLCIWKSANNIRYRRWGWGVGWGGGPHSISLCCHFYTHNSKWTHLPGSLVNLAHGQKLISLYPTSLFLIDTSLSPKLCLSGKRRRGVEYLKRGNPYHRNRSLFPRELPGRDNVMTSHKLGACCVAKNRWGAGRSAGGGTRHLLRITICQCVSSSAEQCL